MQGYGLRTFFWLLVCVGIAGILHADLVSLYTFDGDLVDSEAASNDGTYVGLDGPIFLEGQDGTFEGAISFNGIDEYLILTPNAGLPITHNAGFSVAMWVYGPAFQSDRRIFSESSDTSGTPLFNIGTHNTGVDGTVDGFIRATEGILRNHAHSVGEAFDDTWHHVVWVDDNGVVSLYIDGELDANTGTFSYPRPAAQEMAITTVGGIFRPTNATPECCLFTGAIDELRLYDHALTPAEALEISGFGEACPEDGDTHAGTPGNELEIVGPDGNVPGTYLVTAPSASDDSGDAILYKFSAMSDAGDVRETAFLTENSTEFGLGVGVWTITVLVDDDLLCIDEADDNSYSSDPPIEVVAAAPELVGHWLLDGTLEDETGNGNEGEPQSLIDPLFGPGQNGDDPGAVQMNGIDDLIVVTQASGLPLYSNDAYTVAMWVRGGPQPDYRIWSEANSGAGSPLVNIGTDNTGNTGAVDIYIRNNGGGVLVNHVHSQREAFDNTWHHVAWVDDNGNATIYVDGLPDTQVSYTKVPFDINTTTIGGILRQDPSHWFIGDIDDVRAYNYALTPEEVLEIVSDSVECPEEGDTVADDIAILVQPDDDGPGVYTFEALDADDVSLDPIIYSWVASNDKGDVIERFTGTDNTLTLTLGGGDWRIEVTVDDSVLCEDVAPGNTVFIDVEVVPVLGELLSLWTLNEDLLDSQSDNHGATLTDPPLFVEGFDGNPEGAVSFDGIDDVVQVEHAEGLPLYQHRSFSIAMWVKGVVTPETNDRRVWSESSDVDGNPIYNIGTHNQGADGTVDIFIRGGGGAWVNHRHSEGVAFDGEWHHIAFVDDGGFARLYIDGVKDPTDFSYVRPDILFAITTIGGIFRPLNTPPTCCHFPGEIDETRIYTYALSAAEVEELATGEPPDGVGPFQRGDCNLDKATNITDGVFLLNFLFLGGPAPACRAACDMNGDGELPATPTDALVFFNWQFLGGPAPPAPVDACAVSSRAEDLAVGCVDVSGC